MELKKTPLYDAHVAAGGKMVEFGGYCMPVQYRTGVIREHMAVREDCGLFDVSHMGEILVDGPDAVANLNELLTNDYTEMDVGQVRYSPMCNENGGTVDDLIVYKFGPGHYFVVVNAANKDKDFEWMAVHRFGNCTMQDISSSVAQLALQGPKAETILKRLTAEENIPKKYYTALRDRPVGPYSCVISRTGYTGSDGFEFYIASDHAVDLWNLLLETGKDDGLIPCGLGARDTLRLEAGMPLYGHELSDSISPLVAGLGMFVKMEKPSFIGKVALEKAGKPTERRVGLKVTGRGIAREHQGVWADGRQIGETTSGTMGPYVGYPCAMAIVDIAFQEPGMQVEVDVRGRRVAAEVVKLPFYKKNG